MLRDDRDAKNSCILRQFFGLAQLSVETQSQLVLIRLCEAFASVQ
jgi:hypothetical protein